MNTMKELIKKELSSIDAKEGLHVRTIAERILMSGAMGDMSVEDVLKKVTRILNSDVKKKNSDDKDFVRVKNTKTGKFKSGVYKLKTKRKDPLPVPIPETDGTTVLKEKTTSPSKKNTNYIGKAGEYSVMSELLFHGYNANNMSVDQGVDIVATKDNVFFFVQVKTAELKANYTAHVQIKEDRFDAFIHVQMRYVIVVRCKEKKDGKDSYKNIFFTFTNRDIDRFISNKYVNKSDDNININIKFDENTHKPMLYNKDKSDDISYYMNLFEL